MRGLWRAVVISRSISEVEREFVGKLPAIREHGSMGVYGMDANALFIYFVFDNDKDLKEAEEKGYTEIIHHTLYESMKKNGYPVEMLGEDFVGLVSQEAVDRAGGWYLYFKLY